MVKYLSTTSIELSTYNAAVEFLSDATRISRWEQNGRKKVDLKRELGDLIDFATGTRALMLAAHPNYNVQALNPDNTILTSLRRNWTKVNEEYIGALRAAQEIVRLYEGVIPTKAMTERIRRTRRSLATMLKD